MKRGWAFMHTTNYFNSFISVSEDCPVDKSEIPRQKKDDKTVAVIHYELIYTNPYKYTSDDVIYLTYAIRNKIPPKDNVKEREKLFSNGQPCLRSSPLCKRYGWGIHFDSNGRISIFGIDSADYSKFINNKSLTQIKGMKTKRNNK
jgi:hypothetical protein